MKIAFYAPFKPLGHPAPSGDLAIARGVVSFLENRGHRIMVQSDLRTRWIYLRPWKWPKAVRDFIASLAALKKDPPDLWLTYHTYYKAPDILGPWICLALNIPYVVFQGVYSTKQRRKVKTCMGFWLNRAALKRAAHVFTNKSVDLRNLLRLVPDSRLSYIRPGIVPAAFSRNRASRDRLRREWGAGNRVVILTAAMFRNDVKTRGLLWLIDCCRMLEKKGIDFLLVIAGGGCMETHIRTTAHAALPERVRFAGKIPPGKMADFYSAGDVFAFPGIGESLGMVFLEAQACGLPVVAFDNGGIPEAVVNKKTGFLTPMHDCRAFADRLAVLLEDKSMRRKMGNNALEYVQKYHDLDVNYRHFEDKLVRIAQS